MSQMNSNVLLIIFAGVLVLIAVLYYLNKNDTYPIHNHGTISNNTINAGNMGNVTDTNMNKNYNLLKQHDADFYCDSISDSVVDDLVSQYDINDNISNNSNDYSPTDPMAKDYGQFSGYVKKTQHDMSKIETPFNDSLDGNSFTYKKKNYTKRTPEDIKDLFDIDKMLPQEIEEDWFDVEPLQSTKKIKGTHLLHPKVHMGVNTVGSSLKNGTHDIRGDVPIRKIDNFSPFLNSTIDPDMNIKGFCNPKY